MSMLSFTIPTFIHPRVKPAIYFYPDVFNHSYTEQQYQQAWRRLHASQKGYLIVQKGHLTRVNWFRYAFEHIKGWLGWNHDCQPEKITMAAQKLAYYGYLNGYSQTEALQTIKSWPNTHQPHPNFINQCQLKRNNLASANLQNEMVQFYKSNAKALDALDGSNWSLPIPQTASHFRFGATYLYYQDVLSMARIDVQNEELIDNVIMPLSDLNKTLPESTFRARHVKTQLNKLEKSFYQFKSDIFSEYQCKKNNSFFSSFPLSFSSRKKQSNHVSTGTLLFPLYQNAQQILQAEPGVLKKHCPLFIELELASAIVSLTKTSHYEKAAHLILNYCSHQTDIHDYLSLYFIKDEAFNVLDLQNEKIKFWAVYLYQRAIHGTVDHTPLCMYRIAQINSEIIEDQYLKPTIESALKYNDYALSYQLTERLFAKEPNIALEYMGKYPGLHRFLSQESPLRAAYARFIIKAINRHTLFNYVTNDDIYQKAFELDPSIEQHEGAAYFFQRYVKEKKWQNAFQLLMTHRKTDLNDATLSKAAINQLARYYFDEGNRLYQEGLQLKPDYPKAEIKYRHSLIMMTAAAKVSEHYATERDIHKRLLALIILSGDEQQQCLTKQRIQEAFNLLTSIAYTNDKDENRLLDKTWIQALQAHINMLYKECLGADFDEYNDATQAHKDRVQPLHLPLMHSINQLMALYNKLNKKKNNGSLASLHFLKAECIDYFKWEGDAVFHYQKACVLEPGQAFYHLRYAETINHLDPEKAQQARNKGALLLQRSNLDASHYLHWFDERWQKEETKIYNQSMPEPVDIQFDVLSLLPSFNFKR